MSSAAQPSDVPPRLRRALALVRRVRRPSPRVRSALLILAGIGVLVGMWLSARAIDVDPADVRWWLLAVVALVATPAGVALNAAELRIMSAAVAPSGAVGIGWLEATRTVVLATAANLLPVPAGAIVRIQVMRKVGAGTAAATGINVAGAGLWVGSGLAVAGVVLLATGSSGAGWGVAAVTVGVAGMAVGALLVRRLAGTAWRRSALALTAVEVAFALLHGVRLALVLLALGVDAEVWQGLVLGAAAPLAAAAGIFPSGIGMAEVLTALVAPLARIPEAAGFLVTAVTRVLGLAIIVPIALWLGVREVVAHPEDPTAVP